MPPQFTVCKDLEDGRSNILLGVDRISRGGENKRSPAVYIGDFIHQADRATGWWAIGAEAVMALNIVQRFSGRTGYAPMHIPFTRLYFAPGYGNHVDNEIFFWS